MPPDELIMGEHKLPKPAKPLLNIAPGSGQPNQPASEPPFVPLNPWGRPMPKPIRQARPQLYQVVVKDKDNRWGLGGEIPVGPRMLKEMCELLQAEIAEQIAAGAEKRWSNPVVVPVVAG